MKDDAKKNESRTKDEPAASKREEEAREASAHADEVCIKPYDQKIGEGSGNLRRREQWFKKRTGKSE